MSNRKYTHTTNTAVDSAIPTDIKATLKVGGDVVYTGTPAGLLASEWFSNGRTRSVIAAALNNMKGKHDKEKGVRVLFDGEGRYLRVKLNTYGPVLFHGTMEDFQKTKKLKRIIHTLMKAALLEGKNKYKCGYRVEWTGRPDPR